MNQPQFVHYLPLVTTAMSIVFCITLLRRFRLKGTGAHLLWWAGGIAAYGLGTATESLVTLIGNGPALNKSWYIAGALLGGYPLAQGTVYLILRRRTANILTGLTVPFIIVLAILVALSPTNMDALQSHRPGGAALGWQWIRPFTPLINGYALFFLVGGAALSSWRFAKQQTTWHRAVGNALIAFGALLPAVGGGMAKADMVEALYIGELVGLVFIWAGYICCVHPKAAAFLGATRAAPSEQADAVPVPAPTGKVG